MLGLKISRKDAQKVIELLKSKNVINKEYKIKKDGEHIYIPITKKIEGFEIVDTNFEIIERPKKLKEISPTFPSSYEVIGDIAIIETENKQAAEEILRMNKNIHTVLAKMSEIQSEYRIRKLKYLAGIKKTETTHKENGIKIMVDVEKVYFSAKTGNERLRIAKQVQPEENVCVFFGGVAPYALNIVKQQPKVRKVVSIDINPYAYAYAKKNIELNKMQDKIEVIQGDVRKYYLEHSKEFDRVVMPMPKMAYKFLKEACYVLKEKGIINYYSFEKEEDIISGKVAKDLKTELKKYQRLIKRINIKKLRPYAPGIYKIAADIIV